MSTNPAQYIANNQLISFFHNAKHYYENRNSVTGGIFSISVFYKNDIPNGIGLIFTKTTTGLTELNYVWEQTKESIEQLNNKTGCYSVEEKDRFAKRVIFNLDRPDRNMKPSGIIASIMWLSINWYLEEDEYNGVVISFIRTS